MKTKISASLVVLFNFIFGIICYSQEMIYLDKNFPASIPQIYAPDILSLPDRLEHGLAIRNNGQEHYFGLDGAKDWTYNGIVCLRKEENNRLILDTLSFLNLIPRNNNAIVGGEPFYSPDNQTLYFVADYPTDIYKIQIRKDGEWGLPEKLDSSVISDGSEWYPVIASDQCLYFSRDGEIYKAELVKGTYKKVSRLKAAFNYECGDQVFSDDMDYILFSSPRKGGFGNNDLYIAFRKDNGDWTDGINLGQEINTDGFELAPCISPDNQYLFFTRRDKYNQASSSDIYWVSLDFLAKFRREFRQK